MFVDRDVLSEEHLSHISHSSALHNESRAVRTHLGIPVLLRSNCGTACSAYCVLSRLKVMTVKHNVMWIFCGYVNFA